MEKFRHFPYFHRFMCLFTFPCFSMRSIIRQLFLFLCLTSSTYAQSDLFPHTQQRWVDSVFASLTADEKIGQLLMPRGNSNPTYDTTRLFSIISDYHVGGFVLLRDIRRSKHALSMKCSAVPKYPFSSEWTSNGD